MASHTQEYASTAVQNGTDNPERERVFDAFRRWGYLQANLDPLGQHLQPVPIPELDITGTYAEEARRVYCGTVASEFMHILDPEKRRWIQNRLENDAPAPVDQKRILDLLVRADEFE